MHYNQPFNTGTVFNNGYAYNHAFNPPPIGFYPQSVIGEGDVSCVTLPDGTCQFYFTPTANWCAPNGPGNNMINTTNFNPYWNPNMGAWFVRSITSPIPAIGLRHEAPIPFHSLDCNMVVDNGFQIKFHNDKWTSTTDIHYFYPCLRQIDYTIEVPSRGCAAVQVDTPMVTNTIFHQEVVCSKPCHCAPCPAPDTKPTEDMDCQCTSASRFIRTVNTNSLQRLHLLPTDVKKKRIKLERKTKRGVKSNDTICECDQTLFLDSKIQNTIENKPKNPVYGFKPQPGLEKKTGGDFICKTEDICCECDQPLAKKRHNAIEIKSTDSVCGFKPQTDFKKRTNKDVISKNEDVVCECNQPSPPQRKKQNAIEIKLKDDFKPQTDLKKRNNKDVKSKNEDVICECDQPSPPERKKQNAIEIKSKDTVCGLKNPPDLDKKRQKNVKSKNNETICGCDRCDLPSYSDKNIQNSIEMKSKDTACGVCPLLDMERKTDKDVKSKENDKICDCDQPSKESTATKSHYPVCEFKLDLKEDKEAKVPCCECCRDKASCVEKSVTKHDACNAPGSDIDEDVQCPCSTEIPIIRRETLARIQPEIWCPTTESIQRVFNYEKDTSETCCSRICSGKVLDKRRK